jgi:hypothetical protein
MLQPRREDRIMSIQITASFLIMLTGGVVYLASTAAKPAEIARLAFFVGLFWLVFAIGRASVHL